MIADDVMFAMAGSLKSFQKTYTTLNAGIIERYNGKNHCNQNFCLSKLIYSLTVLNIPPVDILCKRLVLLTLSTHVIIAKEVLYI